MKEKPPSHPGVVIMETPEQLLDALKKQGIKQKIVKFEDLGEPLSFNPYTGEIKPI